MHEDELWTMKGWYSTAVKDEDPITWGFINGECILPISIVSYLLFHVKKIIINYQKEYESASQSSQPSQPKPKPIIIPMGSTVARSLTPDPTHLSHLSTFRMDLMSCLHITLHLADCTDHHGLHFAYQKYKVFLEANDTLASLCASGKWEGKRPVITDFIEKFQSKSMWHAHYAKALSKVGNYPEMVSWLNREKNAPSNMALWGFEKASYNFKDLFTFMKDEEKERVGAEAKAKLKKGKEKVRDASASGSSSGSGSGGSGGRKRGNKKKK